LPTIDAAQRDMTIAQKAVQQQTRFVILGACEALFDRLD
jgi:hypothetical protein